MADRLNGTSYGMPHPGFNPAMLSQQPQQMQQVDAQATIGGLQNPEHGRMWQQMQQQHRNTFGGGTLNGQQSMNPQQAAEYHAHISMMRQHMALRNQQAVQQPFNMNPASLQSNAPMQDPTHNQQQLPNFNGGLTHNQNMNQLQAAMAMRPSNSQDAASNPLMQALQGHPAQASRQLALMGLAHNQQPQNGQTHLSRVNPQLMQSQPHIGASQMQLPQQQGTFPMSGPSGAHASPALSASQPGNGPVQAQTEIRQMTQGQLQQAYERLKLDLTALQNEIANLKSNPDAYGGGVAAEARAQDLQKKYEEKNTLQKRIMQHIIPIRNPDGTIKAGQPLPPQYLQNGLTNPLWLMAKGYPPDHFTKRPGEQSAQPIHRSPGNHAQPNPPRSIPTPTQQQMLAGVSPSHQSNVAHPSPHMEPGTAFLGDMQQQTSGRNSQPAQAQAQSSVQPREFSFDEKQFLALWNRYRQTQGAQFDERSMNIDGRPIDVFKLYEIVRYLGGWENVTRNQLWQAVGGRLGFVAIPAVNSEPARSNEPTARHLAVFHKQYLVNFDRACQMMMQNTVRRQQQAASNAQQQQIQQLQQVSMEQHSQIQPQMSNDRMPTSSQNPMMFNMVMHYVHTSEAEMRSKGLSDEFIRFVESNREQLRRTYQSQQAFRGGLTKNLQSGNGMPLLQPGQLLHPGQQTQLSQQQQQQRLIANMGLLQQRRAAMIQQNMTPGAPGMPTGMMDMSGSQIPPSQMPVQMGMGNIAMSAPAGGVQGSQGSRAESLPADRSARPNPRPPTAEEVEEARRRIKNFTDNWTNTKKFENFPTHAISDLQLSQYNQALTRLMSGVEELEPRMPMFFAITKQETAIRKLTVICMTARYQSGEAKKRDPRHVLDLTTVRNMFHQVTNANNAFTKEISTAMGTPLPSAGPFGGMSGFGGSEHPPYIYPNQVRAPLEPEQATPPTTAPPRQVPISQPANRRKPTQSLAAEQTAAASTPTPPPNSTPTAQAVTPSLLATSPQTPKSPRTKATPKQKPAARRKTSKATAPVPVESSSVAPLTPATPVSSGETQTGNKRAREEDAASNEAQPLAPSPKRVRTEAEEQFSDVQQKRQEAAEAAIADPAKSESYLAQIDDLLRLAQSSGDGALQSHIGTLLESIVETAYPDYVDSTTSTLDTLDTLIAPPSPSSAQLHECMDFVDWSSCEVATPDLVQTTSTNPSPGSGSEVEPLGHARAQGSSSPQLFNAKAPLDDLNEPDPLHIGFWSEIDGGEAAYYQSTGWKWDGPMPTTEQPWAISTS